MGLEARELAAASRTKYQTRIQSYSVELDRLDGDFRKAKTSYYRAREDLLGESDQDYYDGSQKQSLIDNTEKLERGNRRLEVGYKVAIETEQIGNQIMTDLNEQRETIQRTRARVNFNSIHKFYSHKKSYCSLEYKKYYLRFRNFSSELVML